MTALLPQYIYEFRKGVRRLFMLTMTPHEAQAVRRMLEREPAIAVHVQAVGDTRCNVFFGQGECVQVIRAVVRHPLCALSPEQDFMVGALLGYGIEQQCRRFLERQTAPGPACGGEVTPPAPDCAEGAPDEACPTALRVWQDGQRLA